MKRFNPFTALLFLMLLILVVIITLAEDLFSYLYRLAKRILKNYHYIIYGNY